MSITFDEQSKVFHLKTSKTSYIIHVWRGKYLVHAYWGKKIKTPNISNAVVNRVGGFTPNTDNEDYSLDYMNQEYPTGLGTDYRVPAISVVYEDGSRNAKLLYEGYKIMRGKPKLQGLPATYVENDEEADTLYITLADKLKGLKVILMYTVFHHLDVITRTVTVVNESDDNILLEKGQQTLNLAAQACGSQRIEQGDLEKVFININEYSFNWIVQSRQTYIQKDFSDVFKNYINN